MDQFVEMLRTAQNGKGLENLAQICGLSMQQAQATAEAMMPAFLDAFRDMARSPDSIKALTSMMMSGPYAALYAAQPSASTPPSAYPVSMGKHGATPSAFGMPGFPPSPARGAVGEPPLPLTQAGMSSLNTVFGSSEVSKAVANQVAASTGLSAAVVRQAMPAVAGMFVDTLAKSLAASGSLQQMAAAMLSRMPLGESQQRSAPISSGNPWMDAFMAFSSAAGGAAPYGAANPWQNMGSPWGGHGNPWADAISHGMKLASPPAPQPPPASSWQDVVNAMTNTMAQAGPPPSVNAPQPTGALPSAPVQAQASSAAAPAPANPVQGPATPAPNNPFSEMQDLFAQMLVQGFQQGLQQSLQPSASGPRTGDGQNASFSPMDFWLELVKQAQESNQKTINASVQRPSGKHDKSGKKPEK